MKKDVKISFIKHLMRRFMIKFINILEEKMVANSLVGDKALFDKSDFKCLQTLEADTFIIKNELLNLIDKLGSLPSFEEIHEQQYALTQDGKWTVFPLFGFGTQFNEACNLCPRTTSIIKNMGGVKTAFFSKLDPHKHIPPHTGIYRGILRIHLGLIIPQDWQNCFFEVNNERVYWREGQCFVFDDGYIHQVYNNTNEERVVLIIDIVRPLPIMLNFLNKLAVGFIGHADHIQLAGIKLKNWLKNRDSLAIIDK